MSMLRRGATSVALLLLAAAPSYAQNKEEPRFSILEAQAAQARREALGRRIAQAAFADSLLDHCEPRPQSV